MTKRLVYLPDPDIKFYYQRHADPNDDRGDIFSSYDLRDGGYDKIELIVTNKRK